MVRKIIKVSENDFKIIEQFIRKQKNSIFNLPITQKLFDNLTLITPSAWEILVPIDNMQNIEDFKNTFDLIPVTSDLFNLCLELKLSIEIHSDGSRLQGAEDGWTKPLDRRTAPGLRQAKRCPRHTPAEWMDRP